MLRGNPVNTGDVAQRTNQIRRLQGQRASSGSAGCLGVNDDHAGPSQQQECRLKAQTQARTHPTDVNEVDRAAHLRHEIARDHAVVLSYVRDPIQPEEVLHNERHEPEESGEVSLQRRNRKRQSRAD